MTSRDVVIAQNVSRMCMICGTENPWSLQGQFLELEGGELLGIFQPLAAHQGYPGRLHGGVASAILDETIGRAVNILHPDAWGVTAELTVRFKHPVPLDGELRAIARVTRDSRRLYEGTAEIVLADGTVAVEASGKYVKMPIDQIAEGDFGREWVEDAREVPARVEL